MNESTVIENTANETSLPVAVRGLPFLGVLLALRRDALGFFTRTLRHHGDRVELRVLGRKVLLLAHPSDIEAVLVNNREHYGRSNEILNLRPIFGDGLLSSEGDLWRKQRRLIQPKFSHAAIQGYANIIIECIEAQTAKWQAGQVLDTRAEMMSFTRRVICEVLFGRQWTADAQTIAEAVTVVFGDVRSEILYLPLWRRLPLARSKRWNRAVHVLDDAIQRVITARRNSRELHTDLLGVLLTARDEDGNAMSDQQVQDEIRTMFLAGHETSALLLTWALALLARHPDVQSEAAAELRRVLDNRPLQSGHLPQLSLLNAIVQETLRLYPPAWSIGRRTVTDFALAGSPVSPGMPVWLCVYAMHHDERWFPEPERFNPRRWLAPAAPRRFAFLPFGAGPHMCIGQHFAVSETVLALAAILSRFRLVPIGPEMPKMEAWITLRPQGRVPLLLEPRQTLA